VDIKFYPEDLYRQQNYCHDAPQIIITASYGATTKDKIFTSTVLSKMELETVLYQA
jgi:hypothetical protein